MLFRSKDQVIFERDEVLTQAGKPFSVFTPYRNAWLKAVDAFQLRSYPVSSYAQRLAPKPAGESLPALADIGFEPTNLIELNMPLGMSGGRRLFEDFTNRIERYKRARDFPAVKGVSYLSTHLRFGTVSIRQLAAHAQQQGGEGADTWLSELIWRDFYHQILWHHPRMVTQAFRPEYDTLQWDEAPALQRVVFGAHRLPAGGCRHAPVEPDRLHAQPPAHGGRVLPHQGPGY